MTKFLVVLGEEEGEEFSTLEAAEGAAKERSMNQARDYGADESTVNIYRLCAVVTTKITPQVKIVEG